MKNKLLILIFVLLIPLVLAETEIYPVNKDIDLKFTCTSNNAIPSASTKFNITINYPNGSTFLDEVETTAQGNGAFNYTTKFAEIGTYKVQMFCKDGTYSYSDEGNYQITTTGQAVSLSNVIIVIAFLIISIILFILGYTFDKEKYLIKSGFYLFSLLMALLSINSARIIASESLNLSTMSTAGLILIIAVICIMFLYIFITWTIQTFKQVKDKQGVRWQY
jgi:hypothetical protein